MGMKPAAFDVGVGVPKGMPANIRVQVDGTVFLRVECLGPGGSGGRVVSATLRPHEARAVAYALLNAADAAQYGHPEGGQ
jgi:hypothetical protein